MKRSLVLCAALAALAAGCASTSGGNPGTGADAPRKVTFLCDGGQNIDVTFTGGKAALDTGSASATLTQQPAGSGFSYAGGGHQLRGKGHELTWTDASGVTRNCRDQEWAMKQPQIQEPVQNLAGTKWRLVHFQSSDDAIGKIVPPNVERYTLDFMADGSLAMQLDCNRASATWKVEQKTVTGGSLSISPGPMTRAFCGPDAMDTRLARDLAYVRTFTMAGGKLSMALESDAGIYVWEPVPAS